MGAHRRRFLKHVGLVGAGAVGGWWLHDQVQEHPYLRETLDNIESALAEGEVDDIVQEYLAIATSLGSYLQPDHPVVSGFAAHSDVVDGEVDKRLAVDGLDESDFTYATDKEQFNEPDHWQRPAAYLPDHGDDHVHSGDIEPDDGDLTGDCEDHALALCSVLLQQGYDSRIVLGAEAEGGKTWGHTLIETEIDGTYYRMDVDRPLDIVTRGTFADRYDTTFHPALMIGSGGSVHPYSEDW